MKLSSLSMLITCFFAITVEAYDHTVMNALYANANSSIRGIDKKTYPNRLNVGLSRLTLANDDLTYVLKISICESFPSFFCNTLSKHTLVKNKKNDTYESYAFIPRVSIQECAQGRTSWDIQVTLYAVNEWYKTDEKISQIRFPSNRFLKEQLLFVPLADSIISIGLTE